MTENQLFEMLGRLYASVQVARLERDQAREQAQRLARMLEGASADGRAGEVLPSPTT